MHHDAASSLHGTVEKIIIKPMIPRIANTSIDARGEAVPLKRGAAVHIAIRPKPKETI